MADTNKLEAALNAGNCVLIGEWRGAKPETIPYVSKKTGQKMSFSKITHVVEVGTDKSFESINVTEMIPDGVDVNAAPIPFKRGARVMVVCRNVKSDFGGREIDSTAIVPL